MRLSNAAVLLLVAVAARAADPTPEPADSIGAAKKDFGQIRANANADTGAAMPTLDLRDVGPVPGTVPTPAPTPTGSDTSSDGSKKRASTDNWLVDAMEGTGEQARSAKPGEDLVRTNAELAEAEKTQAEGARAFQPGLEPREKEAPKEPPPSVINPLDAFMGGWISARDHELLLPQAKGEPLAELDSSRSRPDLPPALDLSVSGFSSDLVPSVPNSAAGSDSKAGANPYLETLESLSAPAAKFLTAPEIPGFADPSSPETPRAYEAAGVDPRPADGSRSFLPDFAQPGDDDKYFKQLKRF